jgi:putative transposase
VKYQCIADHRREFPVRMMCRLFGVKASGFYAWQARPPNKRSLENNQLSDRIMEIHMDSDGTYGSPAFATSCSIKVTGSAKIGSRG